SALPDFAGLLSASERKRADRFQFDRDRVRFIVRRGLLRQILARYLACDPAEISFTYEARGKPSLANLMERHSIHVNLSHSHGLALIAVARQHALGFDVERVRPMPEADQIAAKFFSTRENAVLNALPSDSMLEGFFHCWTRKEAYLKATGEGIADSLPEVEVSLTPGRAPELLKIAGDARDFQQLGRDRKSTRLNSSHVAISYAVFCLKKKKIGDRRTIACVPVVAGGGVIAAG